MERTTSLLSGVGDVIKGAVDEGKCAGISSPLCTDLNIDVAGSMEQRQQPSDINLGSLQAVKDLKSRFEQLALVASSNRVGNGINQDDFLLAPATSPRPRASSNTYLNPNNAEPAHQLRPSSSSSDLTIPLKRPPPPPPPPRGSKIIRSPSPSVSPPSPLTRPVPIPQSLLASSFLSNSQQTDTGPTPRHVSVFKGKLYVAWHFVSFHDLTS